MTINLAALSERLLHALGDKLLNSVGQHGQLTVTLRSGDLLAAAQVLRDHPDLKFSTLIDLCGVDYSTYADGPWEGARFCVVYNLLTLEHNQRLRIKVFLEDGEFPVADSVVDIWPCANWYEREAFDLYGIVFQGHPDLRRILTDYGFIGHPFRKDFPISGNVEMRYDPDQGRVTYQPVTIEPREIVPRVIREEQYGES